MGPLRRESKIVPGYDCITRPCGKNGCGTVPGASHGQHCDEWIYVVTDGRFALALEVMSGAFPRGRQREPEGATLSEHWPDIPGESDDCPWVDGGRCKQSVGFTAGRDFFAEHGVPKFEQPETFWKALEARWAEEKAARQGRLAELQALPVPSHDDARKIVAALDDEDKARMLKYIERAETAEKGASSP